MFDSLQNVLDTNIPVFLSFTANIALVALEQSYLDHTIEYTSYLIDYIEKSKIKVKEKNIIINEFSYSDRDLEN